VSASRPAEIGCPTAGPFGRPPRSNRRRNPHRASAFGVTEANLAPRRNALSAGQIVPTGGPPTASASLEPRNGNPLLLAVPLPVERKHHLSPPKLEKRAFSPPIVGRWHDPVPCASHIAALEPSWWTPFVAGPPTDRFLANSGHSPDRARRRGRRFFGPATSWVLTTASSATSWAWIVSSADMAGWPRARRRARILGPNVPLHHATTKQQSPAQRIRVRPADHWPSTKSPLPPLRRTTNADSHEVSST